MEEHVVLVDEKGNEIGVAEKMHAHQNGLLHRAFSIFVFDADNRLLLQRRAKHKYHSGGLWANTCCSHPRPGEAVADAAHRRLREEMGFDCPLEEKFSFLYKKAFDNGLTEHEYDHVFVGFYSGEVAPNPAEVEAYRWCSVTDLKDDVARNQTSYVYWLRLILKQHDFLQGKL